MKLCRFKIKGKSGGIKVGLVKETTILDLSSQFQSISELLEQVPATQPQLSGPEITIENVEILSPVENQEVWAAGVTYLRSKKARMEESEFSASAYDKVYEAPRPEIFFKSMPGKVVGTGGMVGIRKDAKWSVPEPELALVINSWGKIAGYTICNDMSSRDIEGENLLYLPQAKIYRNSCAIGPWIAMGAAEEEARQWTIRVHIERNGASVFEGTTSVNQIKRTFQELVDYLFRSQEFPNGVILSTGTGIVPSDDFTLLEKDVVEIKISGIGVLRNEVELV